MDCLCVDISALAAGLFLVADKVATLLFFERAWKSVVLVLMFCFLKLHVLKLFVALLQRLIYVYTHTRAHTYVSEKRRHGV